MKMIRFRASRAAGYILLEAILALAVFSGIAAYQIRQQRDDLLESAAKAHGQEMARIADAANRYALENLNRLAQVLDVPGVANDFAPTVQELGNLGFLPTNYGTAPLFGGGYNINIRLEPAGCAVGTCAVRGLLVMTQPMLVAGQRSVKAIGRAIEEIGVDGGVTGLGTLGNNVVEGRGNWQDNLPPPPAVTAQAGLIGIRLGASETLFNQYLRRDGSLPMLGNLNMLGNGLRNDINNANEVNAITVNGTTVNGTARVNAFDLAVNGRVVTALNMDQNNINNAGQVSGQDIRASGFMHVGAVANINDPCPEDGRLARLADGALLNCRLIPGVGLRWSQASDLGSYCVIQARNESCPAGFSAVDPGSGVGTDEGLGGNFVFGGGSSRDADLSFRGPAPGSGRTFDHTVQVWAFCCK